MKTYELDPATYCTLPGYSWYVLLKFTDLNLELLTDADKFLFVGKGLRGGILMASQRYGKANNKYMNDFDRTKPSSYLQYLHATLWLDHVPVSSHIGIQVE